MYLSISIFHFLQKLWSYNIPTDRRFSALCTLKKFHSHFFLCISPTIALNTYISHRGFKKKKKKKKEKHSQTVKSNENMYIHVHPRKKIHFRRDSIFAVRLFLRRNNFNFRWKKGGRRKQNTHLKKKRKRNGTFFSTKFTRQPDTERYSRRRERTCHRHRWRSGIIRGSVLTCNEAGNFALQPVQQTENLTFQRRDAIVLVRADGSREIRGIFEQRANDAVWSVQRAGARSSHRWQEFRIFECSHALTPAV